MIDQQFNFLDITSVNFGVALRSNRHMYFIPTNPGIKTALKQMLRETRNIFLSLSDDWELHDISEDYGARRRIYAPRGGEFMTELSAIYEAGALEDLTNIQDHAHDVDFYFAVFRDNQNRKAVGIRKATKLKGTLNARNRLMRLVDDTLVLIEDDVLHLDTEFDVIIADADVFILNTRPTEQVAKIVERVAETAAEKVQAIHSAIPFLDLSRVAEKIGKHPRMARHAASVASNPNLANFQRSAIEALAAKHGIKFKELDDGRLQCRVADEARLLELLDARRYHLDLHGDGGDPYRATARQRVSN
ncbi:Kiwa anti-phage protein KwaB-like domain-containing protein [Devosia submarina]|uniref:Kiwa anti-phage protein KwaB-like domain-containing protein n=1 Tax=Devosia submarina TaxID=1173082 RepID=UPI000D3C9563|nr:Kiwa anti-phage protein KwaB-like domain-containing protein [Devosia submarina]